MTSLVVYVVEINHTNRTQMAKCNLLINLTEFSKHMMLHVHVARLDIYLGGSSKNS